MEVRPTAEHGYCANCTSKFLNHQLASRRSLAMDSESPVSIMGKVNLVRMMG
jgi:hypothetical protein